MPPTKRRAAPASGLLAKPPEPKIIDIEAEEAKPAPDPGVPIGTSTKEEHEAAQREYREWLAKMGSQSPGEAAQEEQETADPEAEVIHLPTPEEIAQRGKEEALGAYLAALHDMEPDEPIYTVGVRPPRPQFAGLRLEIGDVVPGAAFWPRLDSWVRAGIVVPKQLTKAG